MGWILRDYLSRANDWRNGVQRWHFDPTVWLSALLSWVGRASNLKQVPARVAEEYAAFSTALDE